MSIAEDIHKLQQEVISIKTSQQIGQSNSKIKLIKNIDESITLPENISDTVIMVFVFKSNSQASPLVMLKADSFTVDGMDIENGVQYRDNTERKYTTFSDEVISQIYLSQINWSAYEKYSADDKNITFYSLIAEGVYDHYDRSQTYRLTGKFFASSDGILEIYAGSYVPYVP